MSDAPTHTPERLCVACRRRAAQSELARFVARPVAGGYRLTRGAAPRTGRGVYVCADTDCFARARERRAFHRAARLPAGARLLIDEGLAPQMGS